MTKLKHAALALAAASALSTQVHAGELSEQRATDAYPVAAFTPTDINRLFENTDKPIQLVALSTKEMAETEGAFNVYGAALGGFGGGFGYTLSNYMSGSPWSWYGFGTSVGGGMVAGSGLGAARAIWGFNAEIGIGAMNGLAGYYGW